MCYSLIDHYATFGSMINVIYLKNRKKFPTRRERWEGEKEAAEEQLNTCRCTVTKPNLHGGRGKPLDAS